MDYQETIDILKRNKPISDPRRCGKELCTACDVAISAMQELQEYKEYGTPNGYKSALEAYDKCYYEKEIIDTELYKYQQIGSLEEVREAVEKQKKEYPQKTVGTFGEEDYVCKNCGSPVLYLDEYCRSCGKKQDWSDGE